MTRDAASAWKPSSHWKNSAPASPWPVTIWKSAGPGELLGEDQSGQIEAIGFRCIPTLLNRAVEALKAVWNRTWTSRCR
jgi:hypothetical protein